MGERVWLSAGRMRTLLVVGLVTPITGAALVLAARLTYPGFNQATQYLSELGGRGAPDAALFNAGLILTGLGSLIVGGVDYLALTALGGRRLPAALIALLLGMAGIGLIVGAYFIIPDPRHRWAVNLGLGVVLCPLLLLWCLRGVAGFSRLRGFLATTLAAMVALTLLTHHMVWPHLVNDLNVGWWETGFALVLFGWAPVLQLALGRRLVGTGAAAVNHTSRRIVA